MNQLKKFGNTSHALFWKTNLSKNFREEAPETLWDVRPSNHFGGLASDTLCDLSPNDNPRLTILERQPPGQLEHHSPTEFWKTN